MGKPGVVILRFDVIIQCTYEKRAAQTGILEKQSINLGFIGTLGGGGGALALSKHYVLSPSTG